MIELRGEGMVAGRCRDTADDEASISDGPARVGFLDPAEANPTMRLGVII